MEADRLVREYLLLGLRLDRLRPGAVDAYLGPAQLRRQIEAEPAATPAELARAARNLLAAVPDTELAGERAEFLRAQLIALECRCRVLSGERITFVTQVEAYTQTTIGLAEHDQYRAAHDQLRDLLPGWGTLRRRVQAHRTADQLPRKRLEPAVQALSEALRQRVRNTYGLPAGESVRYEMVADRPWSGFNSYLGGFTSRVAINADQGHRAASLPHLIAHEAYPGHHTEHCHKEAGLADQVEQSLFLLDTPHCVIAEGLAELGLYGAVGPDWGVWAQTVLAEVGVSLDGRLAQAVHRAEEPLDQVRQDAALLLHDRGADPDDVLEHLSRWLLLPEFRARQILRFVADPDSSAYITTYVVGRRLLRSWLDSRAPEEPVSVRFGQLLDRPYVPNAIANYVQ